MMWHFWFLVGNHSVISYVKRQLPSCLLSGRPGARMLLDAKNLDRKCYFILFWQFFLDFVGLNSKKQVQFYYYYFNTFQSNLSCIRVYRLFGRLNMCGWIRYYFSFTYNLMVQSSKMICAPGFGVRQRLVV